MYTEVNIGGGHGQSPSLPVIDNMEQGTEKKGVATETNMLLHSSGAARGVEGGSFPPIRVDDQKLCNMCVLSLSWNFFVSHDKYQTLQIPYALQ